VSAEEAAALRLAMENDAALATLHRRLQQRLRWCAMTADSPIAQDRHEAAPLKLAEERRRSCSRFRRSAEGVRGGGGGEGRREKAESRKWERRAG